MVDAGELVRRARVQAGLSQVDLAVRAGVAQPMISAYEQNRREPGLPTLIRLVEATGHDLALTLTRKPGCPREIPVSRLGRRVRRHRQAVLDIAARRGVGHVRLFGSVARGEDRANSDIDFLVDVDQGVGLFALEGLRRELSELLKVDVDVVPASSLKTALRATVLSEAIPL